MKCPKDLAFAATAALSLIVIMSELEAEFVISKMETM